MIRGGDLASNTLTMSHFSDIGFFVKTREDYEKLINDVNKIASRIQTPKGDYLFYSDPSGAELWIQTDNSNNLLGMNPHFSGASKRVVSITGPVARDERSLD